MASRIQATAQPKVSGEIRFINELFDDMKLWYE
jgi:hypothetical protein